ncbi:MAG: bacterial Ig-like domain-containing protein, partial [Clostridia bacterium]|nr:bacterial Ig-like domain-containing protein [Clostridia bacterium]
YQKDGQTYTANTQFSVVEEPVVLTGISATFANSTFYVGQSLSTNDFVVLASFSDKSEMVATNFTITGDTTFTTSGNHSTTLSYTHEGVTKTCNVIFEVLPEPVTFVGISATFVGQPIQEGETLTKDHFLVHELYSDDSKINVTNFTFNSVDTSTAGTKQVTITYQKDGQTYTVFVDVKVVAEPVVLTGISATFANSKFYVGDTLTTNDFVVSASYSDNHDSIVTNFTITGENMFTTSGNHTVTLSYTYQDVTQTCDVTVVVLSKLTDIIAQFTNNEFYVGDTLTVDDFVVTAIFAGEQPVQVEGFTIKGTKTFDTDGEHTTTISYTFQGITQTCSVTVKVLPVPVTLTSISATFNVAKFYVGDTLENSNFAVTATFSNGSKANILNFTITSPTTFTTSGNHTVTLSYTYDGITKTCDVTINVLAELTLSGITAKATHSDFEVGEQLKLADFVVTAQFSDGSSLTVSDFTIVEPTGELTTAGQVEVELSYTFNGQTRNATLYIDVVEVQQEVVNYGMHGILSKDGKSVKVANTAKVVDTTDLQIHFLELGNQRTGDCTYIKAGNTDILIDAGSYYDSTITISNYINQYVTDGILEYVIATHAHEDHIAGFVN